MSFNWNLVLAFFVIWHELKRGPKYRINTVKPEKLEKLTIREGDISKSSPYEAVSYFLLEAMLGSFRKFSNASSIVDLGCGKGRVLVAAAHFGFESITGIDFAKELCEQAEKNMKKIRIKPNRLHWKVICQDVLNYKIEVNDEVFFINNPFEKEILNKFLKKLELSLKKDPRTIWFLYAIPVHLDLLLQYGYTIIDEIHPVKRLHAVILKKSA